MKNRFIGLMGAKQARENKPINLTDVARETGITRQTLYTWRDNTVTRFDAETVEALCRYFSCEVGDLLYIERTPEATIPTR